MLSDDVAFVVGVDTHARTHSLVVVDAATQRTCRQLTIDADRRAYRQALRLAARHAPGRRAPRASQWRQATRLSARPVRDQVLRRPPLGRLPLLRDRRRPQRTHRKGVGCDFGNPALPGNPAFPSPARPVFDVSRFSGRLAGFAPDGITTVNLLDAAGNVIDSSPVADNVYAEATPPAGGEAIEALDAHGTVVYERSFDQAP
jgi:hypothetical protein